MRMIQVTVKAGGKVNQIEEMDTNHYKITLKAPAQEGKANEALLKLLAKYFSVKKNQVTLVQGARSKHKRLRIDD